MDSHAAKRRGGSSRRLEEPGSLRLSALVGTLVMQDSDIRPAMGSASGTGWLLALTRTVVVAAADDAVAVAAACAVRSADVSSGRSVADDADAAAVDDATNHAAVLSHASAAASGARRLLLLLLLLVDCEGDVLKVWPLSLRL